MKVNGIVLELMVKDVEKTIRFYQQVLGFELAASERDKDKMYWAMMVLNGFFLSFKEEQTLKREVDFMKDRTIGGSTAICFQVDGLEEFHSKVNKACEVLNHPHTTVYDATQFSMKDNNGYILTFEKFG